MSKDEQTTDKPTEAPKDAAPPKQRKIVRRSGTTRDNPAFAEAPPGEAAPAPPAEAAAAAAPAAAPAGEAAPAQPAAPAPRARATFDARAPRPAPGATRPARPARPPRSGGSMGGDYRPPPARPIGARPIPGGSRAPAAEGDYRPPPARPVGARPIPGGSRAPAPEGQGQAGGPPQGPGHAGGHPQAPGERRERRPRFEGDRPPRDDRAPRGDRAPRPAPQAAAPPPRPVAAPVAAPKPAPKPVPAKAAPKPVPVFIPLARAGQVAPASARPALTPKEALAAKTKAHAAKTAAKPKASESAAAPSAFEPELLNAGADDAVAALVKAGDAAAALVDAWAAASNAAAVVEAAEADAVPGAARKAARRALNVLRSRGVAIPTRTRASRPEETAEVVEATFTPPDVQGTVVITVTRREASGRYHLAEVILREPFGILQAGAGWLSGSQLKEQNKRALQGYGSVPAPVPVAWARHRIAAARRLNAASGVPMPLNFERCLDLVEPAPASAPPHPVADLEAEVTSESAAAAIPMSGRVYAEPEFRAWWPERPALNELLQRVGSRIAPDAAGNQPEVETIFSEEMSAATDRYFSPEVRSVVASRMRDAAISIRARKGDRAAAEVLALAKAVVEAGLITSPPRDIPFLVSFFQAGLSYLAQQDGGRLRVPTPQPSEAMG